MKKIIIPFIMSGLLCTGVCASKPTFDVESNKIVFDVSDKFGNVNIMILAPGQSPESIDKPFYARQIPAGAEFTGVPMPENAATGTYSVYVNGDEYGKTEYVNIKTAEDYLENKVVPCTTSTELQTALGNSVGIFNVITEENKKYIPKLSEYMVGKVKDKYSEFYNDFYKFLACSMLSFGEDTSTVIKNYENYLGINFKEDYDVLNDTEKERFSAIMKNADYKNEDFNDIFKEAKIVAECASADHWNVLKNTIKNNAAKIGINLSDYSDFDKLCIKLMDKKMLFYSYEDIKKFADEVNNPSANGSVPGIVITPPSSGGGGGGGSKTPSASFSASGATSVTETVVNSHPFTDLSATSWAEDKIKMLYNAGIINGVTSTEFAPQRNVTRAEFAKMIASVLKIEKSICEFSDVASDVWYAPYVGALADSGIVVGNNGEFMPDMPITRQDAAVIIKRALEYGSNMKFTDGNIFNDDDEISDYAKEAISSLSSVKIVNGFDDNTFRPQNNLSRAEAAVLIGNIYGLL